MLLGVVSVHQPALDCHISQESYKAATVSCTGQAAEFVINSGQAIYLEVARKFIKEVLFLFNHIVKFIRALSLPHC